MDTWTDRNRRQHVQFALTEDQKQMLVDLAPHESMSANQVAKYLILKALDPAAASEMLQRARDGYQRLTV